MIVEMTIRELKSWGNYSNFGPSWDLNLAANDVLNFIDNHDSQRHSVSALVDRVQERC